MKSIVIASFVALLLPCNAIADVLTVHDVVPGIWAIEGPATQRNAENLGNNATFGLIETAAGAVLIDPGGNLARGCTKQC